MQTLVISYFCDVDGKTYYSDHAKRFKEDCDRFQIPHEIYNLQSQGDYQKNCLFKPKFIYSMLINKQKPILWLDIDTYILKRPDSFDVFPTVGVNIGVAGTDPKSLIAIKASPLWFNYNAETLDFVRTWVANSEAVKEKKLNLFDHETFIGCLGNYIKSGKKIGILDKNYCTWPGEQNENTVLLMGLSDTPSKKEVLKKMGYSDELVEWQSPGNSFMEIKA